MRENTPHVEPEVYQPTMFVITRTNVPEGISNFEEQLRKVALDYFKELQELISDQNLLLMKKNSFLGQS
ncbi:MAG: hypothetical protein ACOC1X_03075 [Promethearchaeota archaeon]